MKRTILLIVLFLLVLQSATALVPLSMSLGSKIIDIATHKGKTQVTLQDGQLVTLGGSRIGKLKQTLLEYSFVDLPFDQRLDVYQQSSQNLLWPSVKGALIGFGGGSSIQGDWVGGLVGLIADTASATAIGTGLGLMFIDMIIHGMFGVEYPPDDSELYDISKALLIGGAIGLGASRVLQATWPLIYGSRYNSTLRKGLGIDKKGNDAFALSIIPLPQASGYMSLVVATTIPIG
ncbi:MAG: P13 family porin [Sphaerochaetaceae bacterium]|jgi:hypothetical protein